MSYSRGYLLGRLFAFLAVQGALEGAPAQLYPLASTAPPQVLPKALATAIEASRGAPTQGMDQDKWRWSIHPCCPSR